MSSLVSKAIARVYFCLLFGLLFGSSTPSLAEENVLAGHASPYLALHGKDPVHWQEWSSGALEQAKTEDKLIFVSIGYFSCHWCHVMQRESFADGEVASLLNKDFVSIKVDRELNPVLDRRLMLFLQATSGRGGWPLNVFLTPDGYPLAGLVYRPKEQFIDVLATLGSRWREERPDLHAAAKEVDEIIGQERAKSQELVEGQKISTLAKLFRQDVMLAADTLQGGFSGQVRFPSVPQLQGLLALNQREPIDEQIDFLRLTLEQMSSKGLRDHVGGGFFRYTVDPDWETPHYEKMLYTNALLVDLFLDAADVLGSWEYRTVALDTLKFMRREMKTKQGAYKASLSAVDSYDVEGGYYLWSQEQLKRVLSPQDIELINVAWSMSRTDVGEGLLPLLSGSKSSISEQFGMTQSSLDKRLRDIRKQLIARREAARRLPADHKRLSGWNGLVLRSMAKALSFDSSIKAEGDALANFLARRWDGGSIEKAVDANGKSLGSGALEDYAYVAEGLMAWGVATNDRSKQALAIRIAEASVARFWNERGWAQLENPLLPSQLRQRHLSETTLPSPEASLIRVFLLGEGLVGEEGREFVSTLLSQVHQDLQDSPFSYPSLIALAVQQTASINR